MTIRVSRRALHLGAGLALIAAGAAAIPAHAQTPDAFSDAAYGIDIPSLPAGWTLAPAGQYTPGTIDFVTSANGEPDLRLSIQPIGTADTTDEASAANAAADAMVRSSGATAPVTRTVATIGGARGVTLQGLPGPANVQTVVAHAGALYNIVTFDSSSLQDDQRALMAGLRFISRQGAFPKMALDAPHGKAEARAIPAAVQRGAMSHGGGVSPNNINSAINMYVFWGNAVNAGCGSHGGALVDNCGGYFYGEGDHLRTNDPNNTNDYYAIDWPLNSGNSIFPQVPTATIKHAGWTQGSFTGYGIWIVADNGGGVVSSYAHLSDVAVSAGQSVGWTTAMGHTGCTGNCSGAHVHVMWDQNPSFDQYGQEYGGTAQPQSPLYTFSSTPAYSVYNSLYKGETVNGW